MTRQADKVTIGYAEYVEFPDWGIPRLRAKTDTGARTSALHVDNIERLPKSRVRFEVVVAAKDGGRRVWVEAPIVRVSNVRSSNGVPDERYIVSTTLRLGGVEKDIEVSLASRTGMIYRMLLGRRAIAHDFLVDPGRRYVASTPPKKKKKAEKKKVAKKKVAKKKVKKAARRSAP